MKIGLGNTREVNKAALEISKGANLSVFLPPSPPYVYGGEGRGEEVNVSGNPSPQSSPHSFLAGRGGKKAAQQHRPTKTVVDQSAFTLLEVMLAIAIFFMAMFALLGLLTSGVRSATMLRNNGPT